MIDADRLPWSKSIVQRVLLYRSFGERGAEWPEGRDRLDLQGRLSEDSRAAVQAFAAFARGEREIFCGESATLLRFLAVRASLERGAFALTSGPTLAARPMKDLLRFLTEVGAQDVSWKDGVLRLSAQGWIKATLVSSEETSQVASAAYICSKRTKEAPRLRFESGVSSAYFELTQRIVERLDAGAGTGGGAEVAEVLEADASCAFALAALAVTAGAKGVRRRIRIHGMPKRSLQPDAQGWRWLSQMGAEITWEGEAMVVRGGARLRALEADLSATPDLFPVLAVVCSAAEGASELSGAPHLRFKESDRISGVSGLLHAMGVDHWTREDGLAIFGNPTQTPRVFRWDPRGDHRMVMAAGTARQLGHTIEIIGAECVGKSFPDYMKWVEPCGLS